MRKTTIKLKENWILYGFETIAIIVGILGAFTLESMRDNKKIKDTEYRLLNEMVYGLERDLNILDMNVALHEAGTRACKIILESFANDRSYHDSLSQYFAMTNNYTEFAPRTGAYESIESLGFDIIQDDKIRLESIGLYEQSYITLQENNKIFREQVLNLKINFYPSLFEEFYLFDVNNMTRSSYGGVMVPINFEDLKTNQLYLYHLKSLSRDHIARIEHNKMIKSQIESLIELITKELNNN